MDSRLPSILALATLLPAPLAAEAQPDTNEKLVELCGYAWSDTAEIEALLRAGADPNAKAKSLPLKRRISAMHLAAAQGHGRILRLLLQHGGNPRLADGNEQQTPLFLAVMFKKYLCAKLLLESSTWTPQELAYVFKQAVALHCEPMAELLLRHGADVNALLFDGSSALASAYQVPRGKACLQYLIRKGLCLRDPSQGIINDAMGLASIGEEGCLELLIEAGYDPNTRDIEGDTLLCAVIANDSKDKVAYLLAHGADPRVTDSYGRSLMERTSHRPEICALLQQHAERLNAEGRPLPPPPPTLELSPLMRAVVARDAEAARRLLAEGAAVDDVQETTGSTPLLMALIFKDEPMVRLLLEQGADIWATNKHGGYPLGQAVSAEGWDKDNRFSDLLWPTDLQSLTPQQVSRLVTACAFTGATARLQQVLDAGIVDVQSTDINRALLEATIGGKIDSARILLKAGIDPFMPYYYGKYSAYDYAYCRPEFRRLFESVRGKSRE